MPQRLDCDSSYFVLLSPVSLSFCGASGGGGGGGENKSKQEVIRDPKKRNMIHYPHRS